MIKLQTVAASVALSMFASAGMAAVVTINSVSGEWVSTTPGGVLGLNSSGSGSYSEIKWGDPVDDVNQSGYSFQGLIPPPIVVDTALGTEFDLGVFTHDIFAVWNWPSVASWITSANLNVNFALAV